MTSALSVAWLRRDHPIVERYLRHSQPLRYQALIAASASGLVLLLGGLSLPVIYLLLSLLLLMQMAISTVNKAHDAATWDLVRLTPFDRRELLLSLWAASLWQLQRTWTMRVFQLLHGMMTIGLTVYIIVDGDLSRDQALALLPIMTLFIALHPYVTMYFSGMSSLAIANRLRHHANAQSIALGVILLYWLASMGLFVLFGLLYEVEYTGSQLNQILLLPLLVPLILGWLALLLAKRTL